MRLVALIVFTVLLSGCEYIPFSSGPLQGEVVPVPADWNGIATQEVIRLETNPADPYSVNLWIAEAAGELFVHAGANRATWIEHIEMNPLVRLESEGKIFELKASRETSQKVFDEFAVVWEEKYGSTPRNLNVNEAYLIRLDRR